MFNPRPKQGMPPKKEKKPLKRTALKKTFKATGEKDVFESVLDNISDLEDTKCFVCGVRVAVVTHSNFGHVLSKGQYPKFRLNPKNIVILCHRIIADKDGNQGCHFQWDMRPRSEIIDNPEWQELFDLETQLKEEYKRITE